MGLYRDTDTYFKKPSLNNFSFSKVVSKALSRHATFNTSVETKVTPTISAEDAPSEPVYHSKAVDLFNSMTVQPTPALKQLISDTIDGLITDGVFDKADCLYVRGVHTAQAACLNWVKRAHDSTLVNSPTFTPKVGFKGDGSTKYIRTNYILSSHKVNYDAYSNTVSFSYASYPVSVGGYTLGVRVDSPRFWLMSIINTNGPTYSYINFDNNYLYWPFTWAPNSIASYSRISATQVSAYYNGSFIGTTGSLQASTSYPALSIFELAVCFGGGASSHNDGTIKYSFYGGQLNSTEQLALYNRIKYFYDHVNDTF